MPQIFDGHADRVTRHAEDWKVTVFDRLEALPADAIALFPNAIVGNLFDTRHWYRCIIEAAVPGSAQPVLVLCTRAGQSIALLPLLRMDDGALQSLTTPYTCLYQPLLHPNADIEIFRQVGRIFGHFCRRYGPVRIEAMDVNWPGLPSLLSGIHAAGLMALRFNHFGNWHEPITETSWADYLRGREGALRETVRRKLSRALRDKSITLDLVIDQSGLEAGICAFEQVYARSWKAAEPYPRFNANFMRTAATMGVLRLGVLRQAGTPIAAQYWVVTGDAITGRTATVLKLAHDEAFKPLSPGTVLTAWMLRFLFDQEKVTNLDFGRGDDPYKRQWVTQRRQRIGLMLVNPLSPSGLRLCLRHLAGKARRINLSGLRATHGPAPGHSGN